jgi:hypothetical protein
MSHRKTKRKWVKQDIGERDFLPSKKAIPMKKEAPLGLSKHEYCLAIR